MTLEEIKIKKSELNNKQIEIKNEIHALRRKEIALFKEEAAKHVGRCFKINGKRYVMVIDVPQEELTMAGTDFNEYQFPAIYLTNDLIPFEEGTFHSSAWGVGHSMGAKYEEISLEEFQKEFEKRIDKLRKLCFGEETL